MTKKQRAILAKAKCYRRTNYMSLPFARHYLSYCDEGYVSYDKFLRLVNGTDKVVAFPTPVNPAMGLDAFFEIIQSQFIGKSTTEDSTTRDTNDRTESILC